MCHAHLASTYRYHTHGLVEAHQSFAKKRHIGYLKKKKKKVFAFLLKSAKEVVSNTKAVWKGKPCMQCGPKIF